MSQAPTTSRPFQWASNAAHSVPIMLCLEYRKDSQQRKWIVAHRMHVAGLANMKREAAELSRQNGWWDWRIVQEYDPRHFPNGFANIDQSAYRTEMTAAGSQLVIPGCERDAAPSVQQLDLF